MRRPRSKRADILLADDTFGRIHDAFVTLLTEKGFASKDEILAEANAIGLKHIFSFLDLVNVLRVTQRQSLIMPLTKLLFYGPPAKARQGRTPSQYISATIKHAYGFALVSVFVLLGDLERQIAETKFKRDEIRAAKALEHVQRFRDAIAHIPQLGDESAMSLFAQDSGE
jgi:hypothetical protein